MTAIESILGRLGRGIHMAHLNCQSLVNKFDELKIHIHNLSASVVTLSETWLTNRHLTAVYDIPGYTLHRQDRTTKTGRGRVKRGGGLAMYIDANLNASSTEFANLNICTKDLELMVITLKQPHIRRIVIVNVYRPPSGNLDACLDLISETCNEIRNLDRGKNYDLFVLGDFNVDYGVNGPEKRKLTKMERALGLNQLINEPTRYVSTPTGTRNSIIDLIFAGSDYVLGHGVRHLNVSDHELVYVTRKKSKIVMTKVYRKIRSYKHYDMEMFQRTLRGRNWETLHLLDSAEKMWLQLERGISEELDRLCPIHPFLVIHSGDPWVTSELLEKISDKAKLRRLYIVSGLEEDRVSSVRARRAVKRAVRFARRDFIVSNDQKFGKNPKRFWENVHCVVPSKMKCNQISLKDVDGSVISPDEVATHINNFFSTIGSKLAENFPRSAFPQTAYNPISIDDIALDLSGVIELIKEIDTTKSSALELLPSWVMKDALMVLPNLLLAVLSRSLATGIFPDSWKGATVIPLHKGGDPLDVGNYRPISLLPLPGKLLERVVHSHVMSFLEGRSLLNPNQGGFRGGRSTTDTISKFTDDIFQGINDGEVTMATFIDLKKAFDTVDHEILVHKLYKIGVRGLTLEWIINYLSDRHQKTLANDVTSAPCSVSCGVPQGSILGPLLFLVYINDIDDEKGQCKYKLYADDTVIYSTHRDPEVAFRKVQLELQKLGDWCKINKLTINTKKSMAMVFGTRATVSRSRLPPLRINGQDLAYTDHYRYLGVTLDSCLTFSRFLMEVTKLITHKIWLLNQIRFYITQSMAKGIFNGKILPYFDYGDILYHQVSVTHSNHLQILQNRALRIILKADRMHPTSDLHQSLGIPLLENRRRVHLRIAAFKKLFFEEDTCLTQTRPTRLGDAPLIKTTAPRVGAFERSVAWKLSKEWNSMPVHIRNVQSLCVFRRAQKCWLMGTITPQHGQA